ncbi:MAG: CvpA family protein [Gammaproteobacteria bacterium]|nr:CvpA family protein [Gammaproteobacteria bacterium]
MKTFDIILLIPLVFGGYIGYKKGLLLELVGIIALILAIIGSFKLLNDAIRLLSEYIPDYSNFVPFIAFLGLFIIILVLVSMLGRFLKKIIDLTILGAVDNLLGALIGVFKWAFLISVLLWLFGQINICVPDHLTEGSFLYEKVEGIAPMVGNFISTVFPFAEDLFESVTELFK